MLKVTATSHTDHNLPKEVLDLIVDTFSDQKGFFIKSLILPKGLTLPCGLHGPSMGDEAIGEDEVSYEKRGSRPNPSRLCSRPTRPSSICTVIAGPAQEGDEDLILYTAFGGPLAPREVTDPYLPEEAKAESEAFWAVHALSR